MAVAVCPPSAALIVVDPVVTAVARPLELTVAMLGRLEVQLAWVVTSPVVMSEKVAVAVNCCVVCPPNDRLMVALGGLTVMDVMVRLLTVMVTLLVTPLLDFAVMVVVPKATAVANPELSIVATPVEDEVQVTLEVTSPVLLLPKVAVALNCCVACGMTKAPLGETASETTVSLPGKKPEQLPINNTNNRAATVLT